MDYLEELGLELEARIGGLPPGKVVFVGVGNRSRGDDAIGPGVIDRLASHVPHAIDAGPAPENATSAIKKLKPEAIVFIDALIFEDLPPGAPALVEIDEVRHLGASAHTLSLDVVMEYLKAETGADVFVIGVQPGLIGDTEGTTPEAAASIVKIAAVIIDTMKTGRTEGN
ncbi:MAG TPA: hydrogenase maturation protease [Methanocella sp.]|nr:hydrogenase maturation protease [Methanocella sp.]